MSEFIDAHLTALCIGFVVLCFVVAVGVVLWPDPHEDEEMEAMRRWRK